MTQINPNRSFVEAGNYRRVSKSRQKQIVKERSHEFGIILGELVCNARPFKTQFRIKERRSKKVRSDQLVRKSVRDLTEILNCKQKNFDIKP